MNHTVNKHPDIPHHIIDKWQGIIDLLARLVDIPSALIMKTENDFMEVFVSSQTANNPYKKGDKEKMYGLYCEFVIKKQNKLLVPNALKNELWDHNPDIMLGMISYLGFPINYPDGMPFGTICVLDNKENTYNRDFEQLMMHFRDIIENDLSLLNNISKQISEFQETASEQNRKDLSETKERANESEEKFRTLFKEGPLPTYIWQYIDKDFVLQDYNNAAYTYTKGKIENIIGIKASEFFSTHEQVIRDLNECVQTKSSITREMDYQFKTTNEKQYLKGNYSFVSPDNVLLQTEDFTERKRAENALIESEAKYKNLIEIATDPIYLFSENSNIVDTNERACMMLGRSKNEIIGLTIDKLDPNFSVEGFLAFWDKKALNTQIVFESDHIRKDGTLIPVEISSMKFMQNGEIKYFGIARDITKRKQAALELKKAKDKAEESDRLKSAFLANMSHEIRTPMNGILGFLSLLDEPDLSDQEKSKFIKVINRSGERLLHTINDIIEISKIETGKIKVTYSDVDISDILKFQFDFFKLQADDKGIDLRLKNNITDDSKIVKTDKDKLHGILTNLIKNAIKFTTEGYIEIGASMENEHLFIYVKDSGKGIPQNQLEIIFDRFGQAELSYTRTQEGSGLGLSIVKAYIDKLNGRIEATSQFGKGSNFLFSIPTNNI